MTEQTPPKYIDDPELDQHRAERKTATEEEMRVAENARAFLISRTHEYIKVPLVCGTEVQALEIRSRLSKTEEKRFSKMLDIWSEAVSGNPDVLDGNDETVAEFLGYITKDPELDKDFWLSPDLDEEIASIILMTYFTQPAANMVRIINFRNQQRGN